MTLASSIGIEVAGGSANIVACSVKAAPQSATVSGSETENQAKWQKELGSQASQWLGMLNEQNSVANGSSVPAKTQSSVATQEGEADEDDVLAPNAGGTASTASASVKSLAPSANKGLLASSQQASGLTLGSKARILSNSLQADSNQAVLAQSARLSASGGSFDAASSGSLSVSKSSSSTSSADRMSREAKTSTDHLQASNTVDSTSGLQSQTLTLPSTVTASAMAAAQVGSQGLLSASQSTPASSASRSSSTSSDHLSSDVAASQGDNDIVSSTSAWSSGSLSDISTIRDGALPGNMSAGLNSTSATSASLVPVENPLRGSNQGASSAPAAYGSATDAIGAVTTFGATISRDAQTASSNQILSSGAGTTAVSTSSADQPFAAVAGNSAGGHADPLVGGGKVSNLFGAALSAVKSGVSASGLLSSQSIPAGGTQSTQDMEGSTLVASAASTNINSLQSSILITSSESSSAVATVVPVTKSTSEVTAANSGSAPSALVTNAFVASGGATPSDDSSALPSQQAQSWPSSSQTLSADASVASTAQQLQSNNLAAEAAASLQSAQAIQTQPGGSVGGELRTYSSASPKMAITSSEKTKSIAALGASAGTAAHATSSATGSVALGGDTSALGSLHMVRSIDSSAASVIAGSLGVEANSSSSTPSSASASSASKSDSAFVDPFQVMDAGGGFNTASTGVTGATHGLAVGYQDQALGYVELRAHQDASGVHASLVAQSVTSGTALEGQLPSLSGWLHDRHTPVESLSVLARDSGSSSGSGSGSGQSGQSSQSSQSNQSNSTGYNRESESSIGSALTSSQNTSMIESANGAQSTASSSWTDGASSNALAGSGAVPVSTSTSASDGATWQGNRISVMA